MNDELLQVDRTYVKWGGRRLSYFAGCDYFRLSSHPAILQAVKDGLDRYGLNVAASRMTTGNHPLFTELEKAIARFFSAPTAVLTGNGYSANMIAVQALQGEFSHILIDAAAHVSLRDATRFFNGPVMDFKHYDAADLARRLRLLRGKARPLVVTDGLFARDGEIAPLAEYLKVLPDTGMILIDDAHAAGMIGGTGQGTLEYAGVSRRRVIQTVTLSKAFGCFGGAILSQVSMREKVRAGSAMFAGGTPLPLPLAYASLRALEVLRGDPGLHRRLSRNVKQFKTTLRALGMSVADTPAPMASIVPRNAAEAGKLRRRLLKHGVYPAFIRYPGGPEDGYFRFVVSSEHSQRQMDNLLAGLNPDQRD